ncbi:MAG TPA: magnesium/cobalt transporter CorA [Chthoniobacteraceae bacterium]|jgi:magnesium transporter|nr:magnesium/cobalt transporter CorA [Chthoniobacteraceae bacterium]
MFKTSHAIPGTAPGMLESIKVSANGTAAVLKLVEYDHGDLTERDVVSVADLPRCDAAGRMYWIEMNGADVNMLRQLGEKYGLHPLALEDVLRTPQRPKAEVYDNHLFLVAQMLYLDPTDRMCGEQVSMFLSSNLLITIQEDPEFDVFNPVRERLRGGRGHIRKLGPDYLAYALLDAIIDHCFPVLESVGNALETFEEELIAHPRRDTMAVLHDYRRTLMQMRRFVWPQRDVVNALLHDDTGIISKHTKVYLRDCYDHTVQIMDLVESYRDLTGGLMELYLTSIGMRTNEIMRVLTVISAIFIPLTFVAGVYGMNFAPEVNGKPLPWNMPELYSPYGYLGCMLFMAVVAAGLLILFKKKRWI